MEYPDSLTAAFQAALAGQFTLERELGRGGMGIVYLARDLRLDRLVAIKVLPPELARNTEMRERFLREARTAGQLAHPNIVPVYRADEAGGFAWFVMAYIDGESLGERVRARGPMSPQEAIRVLREAAWALAYAHKSGTVHRDIKPENILIERATGRSLVTDFGIARQESNPHLTQDGQVLGTVFYMSPEQVEGLPLDGRSDLYSLGVVGYFVLSGQLPFAGDVPSAVLLAHATRPAPPLASVARDIPPALAQVIDRCLLKEREARYQDGEALAEALGRAAAAAPPALTPPAGVPQVLSEPQAQAVWRRAAELQAEATQRLQIRLRGDGERLGPTPTEPEGYRTSVVEAAALEAGISPEYVAIAMAELKTDLPTASAELTSYQERVATELLNLTDKSMTVSRVIRSNPRAVLAAMGRTLQGYPYELRLKDTIGGHPLYGGVLVFEVGSWSQTGDTGPGLYFRYYLAASKITQLQVAIHPFTGDPDSCEVVVHVDLRPGVRSAVMWAAPVIGSGVVGGGAGAFALGVAALGLGPFLAVLPALGGAALLGTASFGLYRLAGKWGFRKAREQLEGMLNAVEAAARSQALFGATPEPSRPPRGGGADGGDFVVGL